MTLTKTPVWVIALLLVVGGNYAVFAADDKQSNGKTGNATVDSVVNEIGKGFEAVGKVVGPAVGKAEKAVRGAAKDDSEKRDADRK